MKNRRKQSKRITFLTLILLITIGFAVLAANLDIQGIINVSKADWDIHLEHIDVTSGSVSSSTAPVTDDVNKDTVEISYSANLEKPGDFYEFSVNIVNDGAVNAMIDTFSNKTYAADGETEKELPAYLNSIITYSNGAIMRKSQKLDANDSETIIVRIEYRNDVDSSELPGANETTKFKFKVDYKQANQNAIDVSKEADFEHDSWENIIAAYKDNKITQLTEAMNYGTTKEVKLDLDHDGTYETTKHVRIANLSKCTNGETSQTACGLVIEFTDSIGTHRMNPYSSSTVALGNGTMGGWKYSDIRAYLNDLIYAHENIDYSGTGLYSTFSSSLRSKIIDTVVVSGYGKYYDTANFISNDKIYLLSPQEIYGGTITNDTAADTTKQLDYYKNKGVTLSNYSAVAKPSVSGLSGYYDTPWLLRTVYYNEVNRGNEWWYVTKGAGQTCSTQGTSGTTAYPVVPAFRLSE